MRSREWDAPVPVLADRPARHDVAQVSTPRQQDNARPVRRYSEPDLQACLRALRAVLDGDTAQTPPAGNLGARPLAAD